MDVFDKLALSMRRYEPMRTLRGHETRFELMDLMALYSKEAILELTASADGQFWTTRRPDLQRKLRENEFERNLRPWYERLGLKAWGWLAAHPAIYGLTTRIGIRALHLLADSRGMIRKLPLGGGWTDERDMPAPFGRTFREIYAARRDGASTARAAPTGATR